MLLGAQPSLALLYVTFTAVLCNRYEAEFTLIIHQSSPGGATLPDIFWLFAIEYWRRRCRIWQCTGPTLSSENKSMLASHEVHILLLLQKTLIIIAQRNSSASPFALITWPLNGLFYFNVCSRFSTVACISDDIWHRQNKNPRTNSYIQWISCHNNS